MNATKQHNWVITIDGPAGSGKSTVAKILAKTLKFNFLDTGAMYRAVAWKCLRDKISPSNENEISILVSRLKIEMQNDQVFLDGEEVTTQIRTLHVSQAASLIAQQPRVRDVLVELQRSWASSHHTVTEGRDQGTVVFPNADCKFFLTAKPEVRAQRRFDEMLSKGERPDYGDLVQEIRERDERDQKRQLAPLMPAEDAQIIDTSDSPLEEVVRQLEASFRKKTKYDGSSSL